MEDNNDYIQDIADKAKVVANKVKIVANKTKKRIAEVLKDKDFRKPLFYTTVACLATGVAITGLVNENVILCTIGGSFYGISIYKAFTTLIKAKNEKAKEEYERQCSRKKET